MSAYRISGVAERTGFSPPTIRYYEDIGLIPAPGRSESGYRVYDERSLERLGFIGRAKRLGIRLEEIRELAPIWELDECAPLQRRLAEVVDRRLTQTRERISELADLADQLQVAAGRLAGEPGPGPCSPGCACEDPRAPAGAAGAAAPIVCTLEAADRPRRLEEWRTLLARATAREAVDGGVRLRFPFEADLAAEVARLAAAEQACCSFFDFTVRIAKAGLALEVRGPAEVEATIALLFGTGA
jgi:DNA-binding transcriptional MerR regulator